MRAKERFKAIGKWWREIDFPELWESTLAVSFCVVTASIPLLFIVSHMGAPGNVDVVETLFPGTMCGFIKDIVGGLEKQGSGLLWIVSVSVALFSSSGILRRFFREFERLDGIWYKHKSNSQNDFVAILKFWVKSIGLTVLFIVVSIVVFSTSAPIIIQLFNLLGKNIDDIETWIIWLDAFIVYSVLIILVYYSHRSRELRNGESAYMQKFNRLIFNIENLF